MIRKKFYAVGASFAALAKNPNVKYLEADAAVHADAVQLSAPWGLDRVDQRLLPLTSSFSDGDNSASGVSVYVVDTGINTLHSEFEGRLTAGYSSVAGGIEDCNGHGTHVAATTITDSRASYSNFGTCLDLFAPGSAITSAWTGSASATNTINGTSMAAPHVAGIIARFIAANPSLSPSQVASSLKSGATQGVIGSVGAGSVNLLAYLDFLFDGSAVVQPIEVPRTVVPGKNRTSPGKKK